MVYGTRCTVICLEKSEEVSNKQNNTTFSKQLIRCMTCIVNLLIITVIKIAFINLSKRYGTSTLFHRILVNILMCEYC